MDLAPLSLPLKDGDEGEIDPRALADSLLHGPPRSAPADQLIHQPLSPPRRPSSAIGLIASPVAEYPLLPPSDRPVPIPSTTDENQKENVEKKQKRRRSKSPFRLLSPRTSPSASMALLPDEAAALRHSILSLPRSLGGINSTPSLGPDGRPVPGPRSRTGSMGDWEAGALAGLDGFRAETDEWGMIDSRTVEEAMRVGEGPRARMEGSAVADEEGDAVEVIKELPVEFAEARPSLAKRMSWVSVAEVRRRPFHLLSFLDRVLTP